MSLALYNTLHHRLEKFQSIKKKKVTIYNCGPTVYSYAHIGNLRAFIFADLLRRYLEYSGYQVKQVINITDVGHMIGDLDVGQDKMENAAQKEKKTPQQIARFYEHAFFQDLVKLNIQPAWKYPRATEHIPEMIKIVKKLLKRGYAYIASSGSVYYDVTKFKNYGKLSGNSLEQLRAGHCTIINSEKKHPADFSLWVINPKHLMGWPSPWGSHGYPGWHIECSAMSMKYLGNTLDLHTGGEDNIFPHHECEIAQSEGSTGRKFVNYWLHTKHLIVEGEKMSKSKGNFYILSDLIKKGYSPRAIRYLLLSSNYRQQLNFTFHGLDDANKTLAKLDNFVQEINRSTNLPTKSSQNISLLIEQTRENFQRSMDDDLNISGALATIFNFVKEINKIKEICLTDRQKINQIMFDFDHVLGLNLEHNIRQVKNIPNNIKQLIAQREKARQQNDWNKSDELRKQIATAGYLIKDTSQGQKISQKN